MTVAEARRAKKDLEASILATAVGPAQRSSGCKGVTCMMSPAAIARQLMALR